MTDETTPLESEAILLQQADAFLAAHGVPTGTREFRLRQEFFRGKWDMRVREEAGVWEVRAAKAGFATIATTASSESAALRLALHAALVADETAEAQ